MGSLPTRAHVLETLFQQWHPNDKTEHIPVTEALGRVLVHDQVSQVSIPVVRASAMDGVAVSAARFRAGMPDTSAWKLGEDFCRADTGDDFYQIHISVFNKLLQILRAIDEFCHCCTPPGLFFYYTRLEYNVNLFGLTSRKLLYNRQFST